MHNFTHPIQAKKMKNRIRLVVIFFMLVPLALQSANAFGQISSDTNATATAASASLFGVEMTPIDTLGGLDVVPQTNTYWARGANIVWADVEPTETGGRDFSKIAPAVVEIQNAIANGYEPIIVVRGAPKWAQINKNSTKSCGPVDSAYFPRFALFMQELLLYFMNTHSIDVDYWEFWNEPEIAYSQAANDPDNFWGGCWGNAADPYYGGGHYGDMLEYVKPRMLQIDATTNVLVGGLLLDCDPVNPPIDPNTNQPKNCDSSKFLEGILISTSGNGFDGVAFHAFDYFSGFIGEYENDGWHSSMQTSGAVLDKKVAFIQSKLDQYGISGKFLMNTESSFIDPQCPTAPPYNICPIPQENNTIFEITKAYYIPQVYGAAIAHNLMGNIWFDVTGTWLRNNGLVVQDATHTALPAFGAYKFASEYLGNVTFVQDLNDYPGVRGYEFKKGNNHIWMLWATDGINHNITLPTNPVAIYDVDGTLLPLSQDITVVVEPHYYELPAQMPRSFLGLAARANPILYNGDFERGLAGWVVSDEELPVELEYFPPPDPVKPGSYDLNIPSGATSVVLGDPNFPCQQVPMDVAYVSQIIFIPYHPSLREVYLKFKYIMYTQDAFDPSEPIYDSFEVYITDATIGKHKVFADGNTKNVALGCTNWRRVPGPENPRGPNVDTWAEGLIDLRPYIGEVIGIHFENRTRFDTNYNTYTYLDDIEIIINP